MERIRVSISLNISAIVLLSIIILTTNSFLIFACIILLAIHLDFIYFPYLEKGFDSDSLRRIIMLSLMLSLSTLAFNLIPVDTILLSNLKIGLILGFYLEIFICSHFVAKVPGFNVKTFGFIGSPNNYSPIELMEDFIFLSILTIGIDHFIIYFGGALTFAYKDWILLITLLFVIYVHAKEKGIWVDLKSNSNLNHKVGILLIGVGLFILFGFNSNNFLGFISLLFFIIGITYIQHSTYQKGQFRLNYTNYFIIPSFVAWLLLFAFNYLSGNIPPELNFSFLASNEKEFYRSLKVQEKLLEDSIYRDFQELKQQGVIPKNAEPIVDLDFEINKSLFYGNSATLRGRFTYNYEGKLVETIQNYPLGEYLLEKSNISQIVVNSFHLSIQNYFSKYLEQGRSVDINILGTSDATSFEKGTRYEGETINEVKFTDVSTRENHVIRIPKNELLQHQTLALLRSLSVKNYIQKTNPKLDLAKTSYYYKIFIDPKNIGEKYRKTEIEIEIYDIDILKLNQ